MFLRNTVIDISGYELNYDKSEAFPINTPDELKYMVTPLTLCTNGFQYLGIQIDLTHVDMFKKKLFHTSGKSER